VSLILFIQTLTRTLFLLAAYPEYIEPLREEARRVISEEGWTKQAMNNLTRVDSLVKEVLRFNPGAVGKHHYLTTSFVQFIL
jgi:cytochrome P450